MIFKVDSVALTRISRNMNLVKQVGNETYKNAMQRILDQTVELAKKNAPMGDSGVLRGSITGEMNSDGLTGIVTVGAKHAEFVEEGTGLYGPTKNYIYPSKAAVMVFAVNGETVFAKRTRGQMGQHYMQKTAQEILPIINAEMEKAMLFQIGSIFE